ncbi:YdcF family protein [Hymenobacter metallicola]|uniref:YdcF family protein n=1 Tax=Hymenobacter metallicola TaxID=2563114 RepID=A0A4Z0QGT4_9BACT|nr:YdcF family protein [Hymenobacter metallicola]TGE28925.1 YdcF family protein [Hymenobacter metallicola]
MFFLASKILPFVLQPAVWLLALLAAALLSRRHPRRQRGFLLAALGLAFIGTNAGLANEAYLAWEMPAVRLSSVAPHDAGVLLSGITQTAKSPHDRVYLGEGADRLTNALWLYRAGRIKYIIVSGGSGSVRQVAHTEAHDLATLLRLAGVPRQRILLEEQSRNTRENALNTKALLARHPDIKSIVLVTSAFHQRRALGCFTKVGFRPTPFPADYRSSNPLRLTISYWLPDASAFGRWSHLVHEITGYLTYKLLGYC